MPFGQSPFAIGRGNAFEGLLRKDDYALLRHVLSEGLGADFSTAEIHNLRVGFPRNHSAMPARSAATRQLLVRIATDPSKLVVIDGAILETDVGGVRSFFEADEVAIGIGGEVLVGENKSWPVVDGRPTDDEALGAALDQAATYVLLARRTLAAEGLDPSLVSGQVALVTPKNTGLQPLLHREDVEGRIRRIERLLASVPRAESIAASLPDGLSFAPLYDDTKTEEERLVAFHDVARAIGTDYEPAACLTSCGFARACREQHFACGATRLLGLNVRQALGAVDQLQRVAELSEGGTPARDEATVGAALQRAARLFDAAVPASKKPTRRSA